MSSRAIRALRGESALPVPQATDTLSIDSDDDSSEEETKPIRSAAFAFIAEDSDSDNDTTTDCDDDVVQTMAAESVSQAQTGLSGDKLDTAVCNPIPEDLDSLLSEFQDKDMLNESLTQPAKKGSVVATRFDLLLKNLDVRDLDYDHSLRNSLSVNRGGGSSGATIQHQRQRKSLMFGPPADGWVRPPRFVGGGIGMSMYNSEVDSMQTPVPWPYDSLGDEGNETQWCTFVHSDSYERDVSDYFAVIQESGSLDALVMFLSHHPYVTVALLQLVTVCYQTNHSQEGLSLLRRCLWIYESSSLAFFQNRISEGSACFLDKDRAENAVFFQVLFRLIQVSNIAGLSRTGRAVSTLLLSMDPLRDPMNVLIALDYHTLAAAHGSCLLDQEITLRWMIDLVDSNIIEIWYRDEKSYRSELRSLPNWAFSYALAHFELHKVSESDDARVGESDIKKANEAIQLAIERFPNVVGELLSSLDVDVTGRAFQRDWVTVLDAASDRSRHLARHWHTECDDTATLSATLQTCDLITKIFVQQASKLWSDVAVLQWLYDNLKEVQANRYNDALPPPPSPAVMRYSGANPADYDNKIQTLPQDANVINPAMLEHAMFVQPNRPRFLRRQRRGVADDGFDGDDGMNDRLLNAQGNRFLGPPTRVVNPDWPMLEVFWRSFLPWNRVEGIPPARR